MLLRQRFTIRVFLGFLSPLTRHPPPQKGVLTVERHPVHKAWPVSRWLAQHTSHLRLFLLPPHSPELNPDKLTNQHVETNLVGHRRPLDQVVLLIVINRLGVVTRIHMTQPLSLDQMAINTVRMWKFRPGMQNGDPAGVRVAVEVTFKLH